MGLVLAAAGLSRRWPGERSPWAGNPLARVAVTALAVSAVSLACSVLVHGRWGHGPGSLEPMAGPAFLAAHPAFLVAAALLAVGAILRAAVARRRS